MPLRAILKYGLLLMLAAAAVGGFMLSRIDLNRLRPLIAETVKEATGREFEIAGALKLGFGMSPAIVMEDVRLQNAVFGTRAEMIKTRRLEAHVALLPLLLGRIEINRLELVGPDILLETDEQGRSNWAFSRDDEPAYLPRPATPEHAALELPKLGEVSITNGLFTYRNGMTGGTTKIAVTRFSGRSSGRDAPLDVDLTATFDGTPFSVEGRLGAFATLGSPGAFPVDLTAELSDVQLTLKGTVNRPLAPTSSKLSIAINSRNLKALGQFLKASLPTGPLAFSGQLTAERGEFTVTDLTARLGESDLQGRLRLAPGKARRLLTASLTSRHLNLGDFAVVDAAVDAARDNGTKANGKAAKEVVEEGRLFSAARLPYDLLDVLDVTVDAKVDRMVMDRVTLDQVVLTANLRDGRLNIEPLSAVLAEGRLTGGVTLDSAERGGAQISLDLLGLNVSQMAQAFDYEDIISGKVDVSATLAGHGESLRAMMASLEGKTSIVMGKGQVKSSYADLLGADLLGFAAAAGAAETTNVNCLVGRFDIAKGVAASRDILFDTGKMTVKGEGAISLGDERFDLKFIPNPKVSLVNLSVPWRVEGALLQPEVRVDEFELAGSLLSAINPWVLLVPRVSDDTDGKNPCLAALAQAKPASQPATKPNAQPIQRGSSRLRGAGDRAMRN